MNFRNIITTCLIILSYQMLISQTYKNISISFDSISRLDAVLKLERTTNTFFYFDKEWLDNKPVSKSYSNTTIDVILEDIIEGTQLNYIKLGDKVILTKNNAIFDKLPTNFFGQEELISEEDLSPPIFQKEHRQPLKTDINKVYAIGKENNKSTKSSYVVSGYIKDSKTGAPIENLVVKAKNKVTSTNAVTDNNGFYSLRIDSGYNVLETSSLSYGKSQKQIVVYGDGVFNFTLEESLEQLGEVLIESDRNSNIKRALVGVTKIDVEGIKNIPLVLGERDILKVATTMPGIKTEGEGALGYSVRGGKSDQNLFLFDDAVMYNPSHFFGVFSAINPFVTGSVDIYKGTIPAEFGGRLSSVIDISTKEANLTSFAGEGNIGPVTGNLTIETPIVKDKIGIMLGARATYSNWVLKSIREESLKNSKASFSDVVLKYDHKIDDKNTLQATGYISKDEFSISSDSTYRYSNQLASIKWNHIFNDKNRLSLNLSNSLYKFNILYESAFNRNFDFGYRINETHLKLIANYNHSKTHKFDYGLSTKLYNIQPGDRKPLGSASVIEAKHIEKERSLESAIFLSDLFEVNNKLLLDLGLRYSIYSALGKATQNIYNPNQTRSIESIIEQREYGKNEIIKTYHGLEVRMSGRYFISPEVSIKAGYNRTIQYLHLMSTNTTASPVDIWKLSDYNIEPQQADQFSAGWFKNFNNDIYEISVESYYKRMNNILDYKVGAELNLNENIETELLAGQGKAYGVEFLIKKRKGRLNGWLGYSYSRTMTKLDSEFLSDKVNNGEYFSANQDRPHDLNLVSNYRITKRYSVSFNFNYQSGRPITYPIGKYQYAGTEHVLYSDRNRFRVPDYYRLDVGVNIEGNHKKVKLAHSFWNISVYNLLGRNNPYSVFFVNENGVIKGYKTSIFAIPVPTITYNFKF